MRRTLLSNLTPEDRATHARWVRVVVAFYGCIALLLLLVAITLPGPPSVRSAHTRSPIVRGTTSADNRLALLETVNFSTTKSAQDLVQRG
jgi:hypothetical protein